MAPRCCLYQFGWSSEPQRSHKDTDPLSGLSYSPNTQVAVFLFQVLPSPGRFSSLKSLDSFNSPEGGWGRKGFANLSVLQFGRHKAQSPFRPGSVTDLKCDILLSEKLCARSFSAALTEASIFAGRQDQRVQPRSGRSYRIEDGPHHCQPSPPQGQKSRVY